MKQRALWAAALLVLFACTEGSDPVLDKVPEEQQSTLEGSQVEWALAIHGGAGVIPKTMEEERKSAYSEALREALHLGQGMLEGGASSVDVVEAVVVFLEDSPLFNAGKGAVFTNAGTNELDAAIMDGSDLSCGAVSGVKTVKNPIRLARQVMTESRHIFFVGDGAEQFATEMGLERVEPEYFFTQRRYDQWRAKVEGERQAEAGKHGTVGAVARDRHGNLAAATSTGGLTDKRFGRVGDVPVIGAGTYANNRTAAISCTGYGEQFIRNTVAHDVSAIIEYKGLSVEAAAREVIDGKLNPGDGGLIAVGSDGSIALVFNSPGMFRGAADSSGRFDVAIWEEDEE
jgi:beta-aspartyl-peptidase (threonine type)